MYNAWIVTIVITVKFVPKRVKKNKKMQTQMHQPDPNGHLHQNKASVKNLYDDLSLDGNRMDLLELAEKKKWACWT